MSLNLGSLVKFDASQLDKVKFRQWLVEGVKLLEPAVITPGNIDKFLFDNLEGLFQRLIDSIAAQDGALVVGSEGDFILAGELPVSNQELSQYLASFPGLSVEASEIVRSNPRLIRRLKQFARKDQELIVGNPLLLIALQVLLPMLFQLLFNHFRNRENQS
jgi:hypothetical protein